MPVLITQGNQVIAHTKNRRKAVRYLQHKTAPSVVTLYKPKKDEYEVFVTAERGSVVTRFILYRTRKWYDK